MATMFLDQVKRQASSFLHEKYKTARMVLTDVTQAELLAEEATNNDPCSPNARTMTRIADASFDIDDYWRIVDVLHRRLYSIDWKKWRQSYKSLVLLDFLLTHGPEDFAEEFLCDIDVIQDLGTFKHKDEKGFDWGMNMQKKSERIRELLRGGEALKQARLKALKITNEIQGFGNLIISSPSSSSSSSATSSQPSSFGSYSTANSPWSQTDAENKFDPSAAAINKHYAEGRIQDANAKKNINHLWDCHRVDESGSLLKLEEDGDDEKRFGFLSGIRSRIVGISPSTTNGGFRSVSDVGRLKDRKLDRQLSIGN